MAERKDKVYVEYGHDHVVVTLIGQIGIATMVDLVGTLRHLRYDCFYKRVRVDVFSEGGGDDSLWFWLNNAEALRRGGMVIATRAMTHALSAAGVMVSLGDYREAHGNALLLYHDSRVDRAREMTKKKARRLANRMEKADHREARALAERAHPHLTTRPTPAVDILEQNTRLADDVAAAVAVMRLVDWPGQRDAKRLPVDDPQPQDAVALVRKMMVWCADGPIQRLCHVYECLLEAGNTMTARMAWIFGLLDRVVDEDTPPWDEHIHAPGNGQVVAKDMFRIPEWHTLYPQGAVDRATLCRHTMVLGEPGSGKTASAVVPVVRAVCNPDNNVGCALVIDPKREIKDIVAAESDVLFTIETGRPSERRPVIDVMDTDEWRIDDDMAAGRVYSAARKVLLRSASLASSSPCGALNGERRTRGTNADPYWDIEGSKLALVITASTLAALYSSAMWKENESRRSTLEWEVSRKEMNRVVRTLAPHAGVAVGDDAPVPPILGGPNLLAIADCVLNAFFAPDVDEKMLTEFKDRIATDTQDVAELAQLAVDIEHWTSTKEHTNDRGHYTCIVAVARQAFDEFRVGAPTHTLYFGCEPAYRAALERGDLEPVDFTKSVDATDSRVVYLYQPSLGRNREVLIAKALKAVYFESVLASEKRQRIGAEMPLLGYIADEAHRFITSDPGHGEQNFLDTCRSFGAFCMLATQSISSMLYAMQQLASADTVEHASSMVLANTATKLFFRSSDREAYRYLQHIVPKPPSRPMVIDVRPMTTLSPGECYAMLADGRLERRKVDLDAAVPIVKTAARPSVEDRLDADKVDNKRSLPPPSPPVVEGSRAAAVAVLYDHDAETKRGRNAEPSPPPRPKATWEEIAAQMDADDAQRAAAYEAYKASHMAEPHPPPRPKATTQAAAIELDLLDAETKARLNAFAADDVSEGETSEEDVINTTKDGLQRKPTPANPAPLERPTPVLTNGQPPAAEDDRIVEIDLGADTHEETEAELFPFNDDNDDLDDDNDELEAQLGTEDDRARRRAMPIPPPRHLATTLASIQIERERFFHMAEPPPPLPLRPKATTQASEIAAAGTNGRPLDSDAALQQKAEVQWEPNAAGVYSAPFDEK